METPWTEHFFLSDSDCSRETLWQSWLYDIGHTLCTGLWIRWPVKIQEGQDENLLSAKSDSWHNNESMVSYLYERWQGNLAHFGHRKKGPLLCLDCKIPTLTIDLGVLLDWEIPMIRVWQTDTKLLGRTLLVILWSSNTMGSEPASLVVQF